MRRSGARAPSGPRDSPARCIRKHATTASARRAAPGVARACLHHWRRGSRRCCHAPPRGPHLPALIWPALPVSSNHLHGGSAARVREVPVRAWKSVCALRTACASKSRSSAQAPPVNDNDGSPWGTRRSCMAQGVSRALVERRALPNPRMSYRTSHGTIIRTVRSATTLTRCQRYGRLGGERVPRP